MNASERIKFIKEYLGGLSQKDLSSLTLISMNTIGGIEKGNQKSFNFNLAVAINKLCKENGVKPFTVYWMMTGEGDMFEEPPSTLERRALNLDELLSRTDEIGKIFDFIRTANNLSIEEYLKILEMTKERYLEICLESKLLTMKEAILLKANFNVRIDDFLFDENGDIRKMIDEKSELNKQLTDFSPMQIALIKNKFKN